MLFFFLSTVTHLCKPTISECRYNDNRGGYNDYRYTAQKEESYKISFGGESGVPHANLNDICSGKTKLGKCSAETVYKLATTLGVLLEMLTKDGIYNSDRERAYEYGLPEYLQHDLDAYKEGLKTKSPLID